MGYPGIHNVITGLQKEREAEQEKSKQGDVPLETEVGVMLFGYGGRRFGLQVFSGG